MSTRSVLPMRVAGIILVALGILPTAAFIDFRPVVRWLLEAGREWLVGTLVLAGLCGILAFLLGPRLDRVFAGARQRLLAAPGREFAAQMAMVSLVLSLAMTWYVTRGLPIVGDELAQRFQATLLL